MKFTDIKEGKRYSFFRSGATLFGLCVERPDTAADPAHIRDDRNTLFLVMARNIMAQLPDRKPATPPADKLQKDIANGEG